MNGEGATWRRTEWAVVAAIALTGLGLRLWGITFGLPALYRPDEDVVVGRASGILKGVLDPHFADWPHLFFNLAAAWSAPLRLIGLVHDIGSAYLAVRWLDALLGTATVLLLYAVGRRAYGPLAGFLAALFLGVAFFAVRDSHFATLDIPLSFAVLAGLCVALRATPSWSSVVACGIALGVAASIKYNGALLLPALAVGQIPPTLTLPHKGGGTSTGWIWGWLKRSVAIAVIGFVVFLIGSPFLVIDWPVTVHGITYVFAHLAQQTAPQVGWIRLPLAAWFGLDPPLAILAAVGIVVAGVRRTRADWVLLAFLGPYYLVVGSGHSLFFRYLDPMIPPLLLLAARALDEALQLWPWRRAAPLIPAAAAALVVLPALIHDVTYDRLIQQPDTRALALGWLNQHVAPGDLVAAPYLTGGLFDQAMIDHRAHSHGATDATVASFLDGIRVSGFRVYELSPSQLQSQSLSSLQQAGIRYVLIPTMYPGTGCRPPPLEQALLRMESPAATFGSGPACPGGSFDVIDQYFVPVAGYAGWQRPGPQIHIYRLP